MKTVVIYKSKTGFVKKYAVWLAEELSADLFEASKVSLSLLSGYDTVIYGGSLHAVGIIGLKLITGNMEKLKGKKLVIFATGASPSSEAVNKAIINNNFSPDQQDKIKFFYLRGGFNYAKLPLSDKLLMTLMKWKIRYKKKQKKELTRDEKGMLAAYSKPVDFTKKEYISEIVEYVNSYY
jgi:menaquinone-dependent protoporphyrinogen IX oxidase